MQPLIATLGLISFVIYISMLGLGQAVLEYMMQNQGELSNDHPVIETYGSPWRTMVTLLAACSGGADWITILRPIRDVSSWLEPAFILTVVFVIFGFANLLTSMLTDRVIRHTQTQERLFISEAWESRQGSINHLRELFASTGSLENGQIGRRLAGKLISSGDGQRILHEAGLDPSTALGLLKLLDTEDSGHVVVEEFLCNLNQLHGDNLSVHLATNMQESKKILRGISQVKRLLEPPASCAL